MAEPFQYESLIRQAGETSDPVMRMAYVGAFAVSMYAGTEHRVSKPFNPILGETYEMIGEGWRYISEQVSHHPPISAAYAESETYEFWGNTAMK